MRAAASKPPEARGLARDGVRLLVATPDGLGHVRFTDLPRFLAAGDLIVVNTSATIAAAVDGWRGDGHPVTVHFSTPLDDGTWLVELRAGPPGHERVTGAEPGEVIGLPADTTLTLLHRYPDQAADRLWVAEPAATGPELDVGTFGGAFVGAFVGATFGGDAPSATGPRRGASNSGGNATGPCERTSKPISLNCG